MYLARVIGTAHATVKDSNVDSATMLVLQPVDAAEKPCGSFLVAVDMVGAGCGEVVFYTTAFEAVIPWLVRCPQYTEALIDAAVVGIVDRIDHEGGEA